MSDYIYDFNHPKDDTIGGSSEVFRSKEFQVTQLGRGRRLSLRQRSGPLHDAVRHVFDDDAAQRCQPGTRPVATRQCLSLYLRSLRRISLQHAGRHQRSGRNFHVVHRSVQLLQLRQLGLSAVLRVVEHALVLQRHAGADLSQRALEDRALVDQWMAVLWPVQQPARHRWTNSVAAEWLVLVRRQPIRLGRRCARQSRPCALSHGRQHPGEVLPESESA